MSTPLQTFALTLNRPREDGATVVAVSGELDLFTTPEFEEQLLALTDDVPDALVVDLTESAFVDSSAGRALLHAAQRLRDRGARLVVVNQDPEVARVLEVMGLDEFLEVVPPGITS